MTWQVHLRITQYSNAGLRSWQQAKEDESIPSLWTPAARREYWNMIMHNTFLFTESLLLCSWHFTSSQKRQKKATCLKKIKIHCKHRTRQSYSFNYTGNMEAGCETESIKGNRQGSESQSVKGFPQRLRRRLKRSPTGPAARSLHRWYDGDLWYVPIRNLPNIWPKG